ncbi:type II toxin-antitoxin system HicB family antitoxin [Candidatus Woesearchaeota archaeon]|nr:type II toxin-antitoxin system HicB family antitoxin [Candidatus Woesearchaeota archaeon]
MELTAIVKKGDTQYVALCPEVDVVSQGITVDEAIENLKEAVSLYIAEMGLPEGDTVIRRFEVAEHATPQSFR